MIKGAFYSLESKFYGNSIPVSYIKIQTIVVYNSNNCIISKQIFKNNTHPNRIAWSP